MTVTAVDAAVVAQLINQFGGLVEHDLLALLPVRGPAATLARLEESMVVMRQSLASTATPGQLQLLATVARQVIEARAAGLDDHHERQSFYRVLTDCRHVWLKDFLRDPASDRWMPPTSNRSW